MGAAQFYQPITWMNCLHLHRGRLQGGHWEEPSHRGLRLWMPLWGGASVPGGGLVALGDVARVGSTRPWGWRHGQSAGGLFSLSIAEMPSEQSVYSLSWCFSFPPYPSASSAGRDESRRRQQRCKSISARFPPRLRGSASPFASSSAPHALIALPSGNATSCCQVEGSEVVPAQQVTLGPQTPPPSPPQKQELSSTALCGSLPNYAPCTARLLCRVQLINVCILGAC